MGANFRFVGLNNDIKSSWIDVALLRQNARHPLRTSAAMRATPLPLPVADVIKIASVHDWLSRFAECVRAVDYAAARPFWHSDIVVFGTYRELVRGLTAWTETQWDNVWPVSYTHLRAHETGRNLVC